MHDEVLSLHLNTEEQVEPWLVWLSGLSTGLQTKRSLVCFLVGHKPGLQASMQEATIRCFSLFLPPFPLLSKNK